MKDVIIFAISILGASAFGAWGFVFYYITKHGNYLLHEANEAILRAELSLSILFCVTFLFMAVMTYLKMIRGEKYYWK